MTHNLNKKNNNYVRITATIFTLAIIAVAASSVATAPVAEATATTTTTTSPDAGLELSPQPIYQEVSRTVSENLINDTHVETTFTANGRLTLPNATETINTTATGSILISLADSTAIGREVITTQDGSESATAKFFGIAKFNMEEGTGTGIVISVVNTNSTTGRLAPLDGMILAGQGQFTPEGTSFITLWEWQSGIPLSPTTAPEEPALTDTTTTDDATGDTDNATEGAATIEEEDATGGDTDNATEGAATIEEEEQQEGEQETTPLQ